jgi:DNA polymerase I-like protein with 3'-5' exonuclease and polymerase domains
MMNPYLDRAVLKFKRYLFHGLRNQLAKGEEPNMETASDEAAWKTRSEMYELMKSDPDLAGPMDKEEAWAQVLRQIMWFRQMLFDMPSVGVQIDVSRLKSTTTSGNLAETFVKGAEASIKEKDVEVKEEGKNASS